MPPSLQLDSAELAEKYDTVSDKQYQHGLLLLDDLALQPGQRVLDIGCGTGRLGEHVASERVGPQGEVLGIDPLPLRVDIARRRASANHHVSVGRAEDLSAFADASFDVVYLNSVYHWLPDKRSVLAGVRRVLKPGGRLGISVASRERPHDVQRVLIDALASHALNSAVVNGSTPHRVSAAELTEQLEVAGLLLERLELRRFADYFPDVGSVLDFYFASSFGNFLTDYLPDVRAKVLNTLQERLLARRGPQGILLHRNLFFLVASAPDGR
ncbi:class I SAM-dependent methyltransferase [Uliginosibacterium sp. H1]|uniref:class I SAM-dependent methyltransferase n=1 Tax=Uliginosibacterium sp. H1 TaxID=3114757 RepID=UPI002E17E497|nr:class I SAM-dependent methyltransferase [Uliginosibacterium sp. H1]